MYPRLLTLNPEETMSSVVCKVAARQEVCIERRDRERKWTRPVVEVLMAG